MEYPYYPWNISIKLENDELERDNNDNIKDIQFHVDVKVEKEFQTNNEEDWCISNFKGPGDLLEPLFINQMAEPLAHKCEFCCRYFSNKYSMIKHNLCHMQVVIKNPKAFQCDCCMAFFTDIDKINHHIMTNKYKADKINSTYVIYKNPNVSRTSILQYKPKAYVPQNRPGTDLVTKSKYGVTYKRMEKSSFIELDSRKLKDGMTNLLSYKPKEFKKSITKYGKMKQLRKCNVCSKTFTHKNWHAHMNEVHGEGGYVCGLCNVEFKCERYLSRHLKNVHTEKVISKGAEKRDIPCDKCETVLQSMYALKTHKRNVHSHGEHVCTICKSKLKSKAYLLTHMRRVHYNDGKMHPCECGKKFKSPRYLMVHKRNAHMKKK